MKKQIKYILTIVIILSGLTGLAQDKEVTITKGNTFDDIAFDASDTINESETYYIEVTCKQDFPQMQDVWIDIDSVSGGPGVTITVYGKKFSADSYTSIGTAVTWGGTADTTFNYPVTTANRYRFYKVEFVADATDQQSLVSDVRFKTWFTGGQLSSTSITDGTATLTSGALSGVTTIAASGAVTIGGALTVTGLTTANGGVTLGAGDDLIGSSTSDITINTNKFTVAGATGNTLIAGTADITGILTPAAGVTLPTESTHIWSAGGSVVLATAGTDAACSDGDRYWVELMIPYNVTLTGISYLIGSVGGTDSVVVQLCNSAGVEVATSRAVGAAADLVGTAANFQNVDFTSTYDATAGLYYVTVQFNGTTAKFRTFPIAGSKFITGTVAGTWQTKADITPGTTFTADVGPVIQTY